jgi:hypothetical protein
MSSQVNVRLPEFLLAELRAMALAEGRTMTNLVARLLRQALEEANPLPSIGELRQSNKRRSAEIEAKRLEPLLPNESSAETPARVAYAVGRESNVAPLGGRVARMPLARKAMCPHRIPPGSFCRVCGS